MYIFIVNQVCVCLHSFLNFNLIFKYFSNHKLIKMSKEIDLTGEELKQLSTQTFTVKSMYVCLS